MGKITLIILFGLGIFLATSVLKDKDVEFAKNVVPKCGDPKIQIRLPKYTVEGRQPTIGGQIRDNAPPGVKIHEDNLVLYKLLASDLPVQETLVNVRETGQVYPRSTKPKSARWQEITFPDGRRFEVYYPAGAGEVKASANIVSKYIKPGKAEKILHFIDWGLVFLVHLDENNKNKKEVIKIEGTDDIFWRVDLYQDITYAPIPIDAGVFECSNEKPKFPPVGGQSTLQVENGTLTKEIKKWVVE